MIDENKLSIPPLVDTHGVNLDNGSGGPKNATDDGSQLDALKAEIETLRQSVGAIATTMKELATEKVDVTVSDIEETLKQNVFMSVGVAAVAGYLWGRLR